MASQAKQARLEHSMSGSTSVYVDSPSLLGLQDELIVEILSKMTGYQSRVENGHGTGFLAQLLCHVISLSSKKLQEAPMFISLCHVTVVQSDLIITQCFHRFWLTDQHHGRQHAC